MVPDPHHLSVTHLQDIFYANAPQYSGRFTTPTLYDIKTGKIVNNESADIMKMLDTTFDVLLAPGKRAETIYPVGRKCEIALANSWIYDDINNGVYRAGFAQ